MWWLAGAAAGVNAISKYAQNRRATARQKSALDSASQLTDSERAYQSKLEKRVRDGDPNIGSMQNRIIGNIRQQGQFNRQSAMGQAINQGLENSIVAQELRRRVDVDTMRQIADESRRLAEYNRKYKERSEDQLDSFNMQRDERLRNIALQRAQLPSEGQMNMQLIGDLAGAGLQAYGDYSNYQNIGKVVTDLGTSGKIISRGGRLYLISPDGTVQDVTQIEGE